MMNDYFHIISVLAPFFIFHFVFNIYFYFFKKNRLTHIIAVILVILASLCLFIFYDPWWAMMTGLSFAGLFVEKVILKRIPILNKVFASLLVYLFFMRRISGGIFAVFLLDYCVEFLTVGLYVLLARKGTVHDPSTKSRE